MPDMRYFSTRGGKETLSFEEVSFSSHTRQRGEAGKLLGSPGTFELKVRTTDAHRPS